MLWRTWGGRCIYHSATGIRIFDNLFFRWLQFESNAVQTLLFKMAPQYFGLNYVKNLIFVAKEKPGNVCMLGLGGGGVAHALSPYLSDSSLTSVEYNSELIPIAAQFFSTNSLKNLTTIHKEAYEFVSESCDQFQHLIVDLFDDNTFPDSCCSEEFFMHCRRILVTDGFLAINLANRHEHRPIFEMIKTIFCGATVAIPVRNCANLVIVACKTETVSTLLDTFKQSLTLKRLVWDETWGCIAEL